MLRKTFLLAPLALAVVLAGCFGTETERSDDADRGGGTGGGGGLCCNDTIGAGGNATGNGTAGNMSIGTVGNATVGNETGNVSGNATANLTVEPRELSNGTYAYSGVAPAEVAFVVDAPYAQLVVNASMDGLIMGLNVVLVDPGGNETVLLQGGVSATGEESQVVLRPPQGTWMLRFEGNGAGRVTVTVRGE